MFSFYAKLNAMKLQPSFFDIFGALGFIVIILVAIRGLLNSGTLPEWMFVALLLIGVIGFSVDVVIVYKTYLKK